MVSSGVNFFLLCNCVANRFVIAGEVASRQWAGGHSVRAGHKPDAFRRKGVASIEQPLRLDDGLETDIVALRINALLQPVNPMCQCDIRTLEQINTALQGACILLPMALHALQAATIGDVKAGRPRYRACSRKLVDNISSS